MNEGKGDLVLYSLGKSFLQLSGRQIGLRRERPEAARLTRRSLEWSRYKVVRT